MAETWQQLMTGLSLLGQLQPFTITLARGMSVPADANWTRGLSVRYPFRLAGLPPPAPRTILDLYQVSPKPLNPKPSWACHHPRHEPSWASARCAQWGLLGWHVGLLGWYVGLLGGT